MSGSNLIDLTEKGAVWTLVDARNYASRCIDEKAERARLKYITPGAGQAATYLAKAAQAGAFKTALFLGQVPGYVQAEADARGVSSRDAAESILAEELAWHAVGATIERARRIGKVAVAAAIDFEAVSAAQAAALVALEAL